jgi:hypothetical protein
MNISNPLIKIIEVALNTLMKVSGTDSLPVTDLESA